MIQTEDKARLYLRLLNTLLRGAHATGAPCHDLHVAFKIVSWFVGEAAAPIDLNEDAIVRLEESAAALEASRTP